MNAFFLVKIAFFVKLYYNVLMKEKRYYFNGDLCENSYIVIDGEEFHHLTNVMRTRVGDRICLFNGNGNFYFAEVKTINKKNAEIYIDKKEESTNEPTIHLSVFQALAKGDKLSLIMQKITEIGASELCLFESDYCDVKAHSNKQERMDNISVSAAKQCGRATIVESKGIYKIKDIAEMIKDYDAFFVAYENEDGHTLTDSLLKNKNKLKKVAIMIGAEGGFSEKEIQLLKDSGADIVSLGKRILRTETASIVCAGLISQILEN